MPFDLPKYGNILKADIEREEPETLPIVEEFLYEQTSNAVYGDPFTGKSTIAVQLALCLTRAVPLFGVLPIPSPRRVYFMQMEGSFEETKRRMRRIRQVIDPDFSNLAWDFCEGINIAKDQWVAWLFQRIEKVFKPEVIIIDPLYPLVAGGLSKDETASMLVRFCQRLKMTFGCSLCLFHHTHRPKDLLIEETNPFYGSQWIEAHMDVSWHLKSTDPKTRKSVALIRTKARALDVLHRIDLQYDPDTDTCFSEMNLEGGEYRAKLLAILYELKRLGKTTDFYELKDRIGCSEVWLRKLMHDPSVEGLIEFVRQSGKRTIWKPR